MLNYFLLLFLIAYVIFRFSKPPPSIDDYKKKKEPDVYNIEKIYMISSICFVICTIFIILQPFTLMVIPTYFIAFPTVFFGIFNTVMTVLFIKYRDDIYFFESYNLIFTLLVTFIGMYSIYNPLDKQLFQLMSCPTDIPQETNRRTIGIADLYHDPHYVPEPRELASRGYRATDHVETDSGGNLITDPLDRLTLDRLRRRQRDFNQQEQLNSQKATLHEKFDELKNPPLTRKKFNSSRKNKVQDIPRFQTYKTSAERESLKSLLIAPHPLDSETVRGQEFDNPELSRRNSRRNSRISQGFTTTQNNLSSNYLDQENSS